MEIGSTMHMDHTWGRKTSSSAVLQKIANHVLAHDYITKAFHSQLFSIRVNAPVIYGVVKYF